MVDYYQLLRLSRDASYAAVTDAYNRLKAQYADDPSMLRRLEEAWSTLSNPLTRSRYLRELAESGDAPPDAPPAPPPAGEPPRRGKTELVDIIAPAPAAGRGKGAIDPPARHSQGKPARPATEIVDVSSLGHPPAAVPQGPAEPPPGGRRPATEMVDVGSLGRPPAAVPQGPAEPPPGGRRPTTELMDVGPPPEAGPPPAVSPARPQTVLEDMSAPAPGGRPVTEFADIEHERQARPEQPVISAPLGPITVWVTDERRNERPYQLGDGRHVIGRPTKSGPDPAIPLDDRFISRTHSVIRKEGSDLVVRDCQSVNGTRLNGVRLTPEHDYPLSHGHTIEIETFRLRIDFGAG